MTNSINFVVRSDGSGRDSYILMDREFKSGKLSLDEHRWPCSLRAAPLHLGHHSKGYGPKLGPTSALVASGSQSFLSPSKTGPLARSQSVPGPRDPSKGSAEREHEHHQHHHRHHFPGEAPEGEHPHHAPHGGPRHVGARPVHYDDLWTRRKRTIQDAWAHHDQVADRALKGDVPQGPADVLAAATNTGAFALPDRAAARSGGPAASSGSVYSSSYTSLGSLAPGDAGLMHIRDRTIKAYARTRKRVQPRDMYLSPL